MSRIWTLAQARQELPAVQESLEICQAALVDLQEANEQVTDIERLHGGPPSVTHPDHADWLTWSVRQDNAASRLREQLRAFELASISVKDINAGLVDFLALMGDKQVWLCWRIGEPDIGHYHDLEGGFSGRRPIPKFD